MNNFNFKQLWPLTGDRRVSCRYFWWAVTALFLTVFLVLPVLLVIGEGLRWHLLVELFRNPIYSQGLLNSLAIAVVTTLLVLLIATPLAIWTDKWDFPGKKYTNFLVLIPMILPPFVGALGFQHLLGHYGAINTLLGYCGFAPVDFLGGGGKFWSVCLIEALHLYPILYLNLLAALGNIDPSLEDAAANLGAGRGTRFWRITLPLLKPGLLAGVGLVLIWSFTELGTPLMFGYNRTTAVQIFNGLNELDSNPMPYTLVAVMLTASALLYYLLKTALRQKNGASLSKGMCSQLARPAGKFAAWKICGAFVLVTFLAALPHLSLLGAAFTGNWYQTVLPEGFTLANFNTALSNDMVLPSIANSLRYSLIATLLALVLGVLIAMINQRWRLKGGWLLDLLAMLPLAVPGIVIAFGYLGMASALPAFRHFFDPLGNPLLLLGVAYAVRRLPYVVRSVSAGLEQTPEDYEYAALNLGASRFGTFKRILLPLIFANMLVGGLFAFGFSMLEVSDSLILAQKTAFYPITKAIYELAQMLGPGSAIACAFGVWTMLFLASVLAAAAILLGKKLGSVFRL